MELLLCVVLWGSMIITALVIEKRVNKRLDPAAVEARYQMQRNLE